MPGHHLSFHHTCSIPGLQHLPLCLILGLPASLSRQPGSSQRPELTLIASELPRGPSALLLPPSPTFPPDWPHLTLVLRKARGQGSGLTGWRARPCPLPTSSVRPLAFKPRAQSWGTRKLHMVKFLLRLNILGGPRGLPAPHLPERPAVVLCSCPGPHVRPGLRAGRGPGRGGRGSADG